MEKFHVIKFILIGLVKDRTINGKSMLLKNSYYLK